MGIGIDPPRASSGWFGGGWSSSGRFVGQIGAGSVSQVAAPDVRPDTTKAAPEGTASSARRSNGVR
jgi:hypothetical protein